ncbi:MAG: hypothetical protein OEY50_11705 [Nitrospinota bacterium]|nr:hypothetical protein [Nitrospinota bacterium]MDH5679608.1 hypothetical protein [Nitrospinota bacterium]
MNATQAENPTTNRIKTTENRSPAHRFDMRANRARARANVINAKAVNCNQINSAVIGQNL